jgi:tryptophan-rich sensory protein
VWTALYRTMAVAARLVWRRRQEVPVHQVAVLLMPYLAWRIFASSLNVWAAAYAR